MFVQPHLKLVGRHLPVIPAIVGDPVILRIGEKLRLAPSTIMTDCGLGPMGILGLPLPVHCLAISCLLLFASLFLPLLRPALLGFLGLLGRRGGSILQFLVLYPCFRAFRRPSYRSSVLTAFDHAVLLGQGQVDLGRIPFLVCLFPIFPIDLVGFALDLRSLTCRLPGAPGIGSDATGTLSPLDLEDKTLRTGRK